MGKTNGLEGGICFSCAGSVRTGVFLETVYYRDFRDVFCE